MTYPDTAKSKADLEKVFSDVDVALENLISKYRDLYITDQDDPLREQLGAFFEELEGLRKKISNTKEILSDRVESVEDVAQYLEDLVDDVTEYKQENEANTVSNDIMAAIDSVESLIGVGGAESSEIEAAILENPQTQTENYFRSKKKELDEIIAANPDFR